MWIWVSQVNQWTSEEKFTVPKFDIEWTWMMLPLVLTANRMFIIRTEIYNNKRKTSSQASDGFFNDSISRYYVTYQFLFEIWPVNDERSWQCNLRQGGPGRRRRPAPSISLIVGRRRDRSPQRTHCPAVVAGAQVRIYVHRRQLVSSSLGSHRRGSWQSLMVGWHDKLSVGSRRAGRVGRVLQRWQGPWGSFCSFL